MIRSMFKVFMLLVLLAQSYGAVAEDVYRLTGVARVRDAEPSAPPKLELPVRGDSFHLNYDGTATGVCDVKVNQKYPFAFNIAPLGNPQLLNKFLEEKFHANSNDWSAMYLLKEANQPGCDALSFASVYAAGSRYYLLSRDFLYVFELERHPFRDAAKGFDCGAARTAVEHLICEDPKLQKMDADVNYGFVLMQEKYSKEISYQDPIRVDQINWVLNVRNKCTTADCLLKVYASRVNYIKGKVSDSYPSYPEQEND
jgi:hypothetical protein